jgi:LPS-assembly protein
MRRRGPALLLAAGLLAAAPVAFPQADTAGTELPAVLTADSVTYDRETKQLVAAGDVEVLYQGRVLRATRIVYDERADSIRAEGPLTLTDPDGGVLFADSAALTPDLEEGLVSSARLLIDGQLQLAAAEVRRTGGRYATLQPVPAACCRPTSSSPTSTVSASSCPTTGSSAPRPMPP